MPNNSVLIVYDYFYPGYRAGGPVQSLTNLIIALQNEYSFSVLTSAYDLMSPKPYSNIRMNEWNSMSLPQVESPVNVWYADKGRPSFTELKQLINQLKPTIVYVNGIYSFRMFLQTLFLSRFWFSSKVVICPRGMLQSGALSVKSSKKKYYIKALQISGLLTKAAWHATNREEASDISTFFPKNQGVTIAENIPKSPLSNITFPEKKVGQLKLVYLSLITEKKNLLQLLNVLKELNNPGIQLHIYGPVKDEEYWKSCQSLISQMEGSILYCGDVEPINVQKTLEQYHALILLTKGENFGHALYESLSVGRPLITSNFTPWIDLWSKKAGANVDINSISDCKNILNKFLALEESEYHSFCKGAHFEALKYAKSIIALDKYKELFC